MLCNASTLFYERLQEQDEEEVRCTAEGILKLLNDSGLDLGRSVKVLTPQNNWRQQLNAKLQTVLNEGARQQPRVPDCNGRFEFPNGIWEGDQVVQTKNCYVTDVFNGDFGRVVEVEVVGRSVTTPAASTATSGSSNAAWVRKEYVVRVQYNPRFGSDEPHMVSYSFSSRQPQPAAEAADTTDAPKPGNKKEGKDEAMLALEANLQQAWAVTVHKAQGQQFPVIVVVLHHSQSTLLRNRNLLYTAVTRASHLLIVLATPELLDAAAQRRPSTQQSSLLRRVLHDAGLDQQRRESGRSAAPVAAFPWHTARLVGVNSGSGADARPDAPQS